MLAFVKRNSKEFLNPYTRKSLYTALVRSKLDYANMIWNPIYKVHTYRVEKLQKKFIKFALAPIAFVDPLPSYEDRCKLIHLETLSNHRSKCSIKCIYKIVNGVIDCPLLLETIGFNLPVRCLRQFEFFSIPLHRSNYANHEPILRALKEFNKLSSLHDLDFAMSLNKFNSTLDLIYF
ncbi:uncharacterized protein LOC142235398 [Haematobia irritans]|uniref:uncharacterized protein LOC142235398 n=1 Tax=Haematobia irritans TaxID=7368 RepID=UPI003F4FC46A